MQKWLALTPFLFNSDAVGGATGCAYDQAGRHFDANRFGEGCRGYAVHTSIVVQAAHMARRVNERQEHFGGASAHFIKWLAHSCQRRFHVGRSRVVIEANHGHILWHAQTALLCCRNSAIGHIIATGENSAGTLIDRKVKKGVSADMPRKWHEIAFTHKGGV